MFPAPLLSRPASLFALLAALIVALLAPLWLAPAHEARAAGLGPALEGPAGRIGAYELDGRLVYCLEPEKPAPLGATESAGFADGARFQASAADMARVNWVISTHGQTSNPGVAAAVALFVWSTLAPGRHDDPDGLDPALLARIPEADLGPVLGVLEQLRSWSAGVSSEAPGASGAALELSTDPLDGRRGAIHATLAAESDRAAVELEGAVFATTGSASGELSHGEEAEIRVAGSDADDGDVRVQARARVEQPGVVWSAKLEVFHTPGAQLLGGGGGSAPAAYQLEAEDRAPRRAAFSPIVTTVVAEAAAGGDEPLIDAWTIDLATDSPWLQDADGRFAAVTAHGTLYGPLDARPEEAGTPPPDAPVAADIEVVLGGGTDDPVGQTVGVSTEQANGGGPFEPGWYTWVAEIRADEQPQSSLAVLPEGYAWRDAFGAASETLLVTPVVRTEAQAEGRPGEAVRDVAVINGVVPEGAMIDFELFREDYLDGRPRCETPVASTMPAHVASGRQTGLRLESPGVTVAEAGVYWWVETLRDSDGQILHRGECGLANETTTVTAGAVPDEAPLSPLVSTGSDGRWWPFGLAASALVTAGVMLVAAVRRRFDAHPGPA